MTPEEHLLLRDLIRESCRPSPYWHSRPATQSLESVQREIEWLKQQGMIGLGKKITSFDVVPKRLAD